MKKLLLLISVCLLVFTTIAYPVSLVAEEMQDENVVIRQELGDEAQDQQDSAMMSTLAITYYTKTANADGTFTTIKSYTSFDDALAAMKASSNANTVVTCSTKAYNGVVAMKDGIAVAVPVNSTMNIYMPGTTTAYTYIPAKHVLFYYSTTSTAKVKVGISGYVGEANLTELNLIPRVQVIGQSYYYVDSDNDIIHKIATIGSTSRTPSYASYTYLKAPSFLKQSIQYYSLDGRSFYTDPQLKNLVGILSNYYNLLPVRSKTNYTAEELNYYISLLNKPTSVLNGQAQVFIDAQNAYGVNAATLLSIAFLESAYGTSSYAVNRYNLFGINAGDANPDDASYYSSVADCVNYMARRLISQGYCDANTDSRYFGANLGNKQQGFNVKYASDPYWGQKIAGLFYKIDRKLGYKDKNAYNLAITNTADYVYYTPSSTLKMYRLSMKSNTYPLGIPVIVLEATNTTYYKIQSDMPIDDTTGLTSCYCDYNYSDVGYVKKSSVSLVSPSTLIDKTYLEDMIITTEAVDQSKYTTDSVSKLQTAYAAAVAVNNNDYASQSQINTAYNNLKAAYDALAEYVAVTSVALNKTSVSAENLNTIQLTATVNPSNASVCTVAWSSSNTSVATVSSAGVVTPKANGQATIYAKSNDSRVSKEASCVITVNVTSIASNAYTVDSTNKLIKNIMQKTSVSTFLSNIVLPSGTTAKVYKSLTQVTSGYVGTNMTVNLYKDSALVQTLTLSVKGDLNADGVISISDLVMIKSHLLAKSTLTGMTKISGDMNGDGTVSISDFVMVKAVLLGK
jgi:beta-N-acetylglucosaminidase